MLYIATTLAELLKAEFPISITTTEELADVVTVLPVLSISIG